MGNVSRGNKPRRTGHGCHGISPIAADVVSVSSGLFRLLHQQEDTGSSEDVCLWAVVESGAEKRRADARNVLDRSELKYFVGYAAAGKITKDQRRIIRARKNHIKKTRRKLRSLGIKLTKVPKCKWDSS